MKDFQGTFQPVLPHPIKWSESVNLYGHEEKSRQLQLHIPVESIDGFISHLKVLKEAEYRYRSVKGWDYKKQKPIQVKCVSLTSNGYQSGIGSYGTINPSKNTDLYNR